MVQMALKRVIPLNGGHEAATWSTDPWATPDHPSKAPANTTIDVPEDGSEVPRMVGKWGVVKGITPDRGEVWIREADLAPLH
jgi:hypothetical protein